MSRNFLTRDVFISLMQGCFSMAEVHTVEGPGRLAVLVAGEAMQQELAEAAHQASEVLPAGVVAEFVHYEDAKKADALMAAFKLGGHKAFFGYPKPDL